MTTKKDQIARIIKDVWRDSDTGLVCIQILNYLSTPRVEEICKITSSTLASITHKKYSNDDLYKAAMYLSGANPHLLDIQFLYYVDEDISMPITQNDIIEAKKSGVFIDPYGNKIKDYEDHISFYFRPSNEAKEMHKEF